MLYRRHSGVPQDGSGQRYGRLAAASVGEVAAAELAEDLSALYAEMDAQETVEAKLYKALDKLEAVIQHNESPLDTWAENEYELNKSYAFDTVAFSDWLTELRKAVLEETIEKIGEISSSDGCILPQNL